METEIVASRRNGGEIKAVKKINILVVDDDATCLSVVAAKLKKFHYQVATAKHPNDALGALRIKDGKFDLVVTDVHMPGMNGIQLQQVIAREFNLPVVLMSADGKEDIVVRGLESGAEFFMRKPISSDDIMDLWQHSCKKKLRNKVVIEEMDEDIVRGRAPFNMNSLREDNVDNISKRLSPTKDGSRGNRGERCQIASRKKRKVAWTHSLHNRFLEAIRTIGFDRAAPKTILERMNVPGLTRENVASHLQKYRIFLRRVYGEATIGIKTSIEDQKSFSMTFAPRFKPSTTSSGKSNTSIKLRNNFTSVHNQDHQHSTGVYFPYHESSSSSNLATSGVNYEVPTWITGINPAFDFSMPISSNVAYQSNVQLLFTSKQSFNGEIDFPGNLELQTNNVEVVSDPNNNCTSVGNLAWQSTTSSNTGFDTSYGGGNISDVIKECHMLCSNASDIENVDGLEKLQNSANSAPFDLDQLLNLPIDESNFNIGSEGQNHIQIADENIGSSNFRTSTSGWDNHISSFDEDLNELIDQDDFLKSLFDPALFEEDDNFEMNDKF